MLKNFIADLIIVRLNRSDDIVNSQAQGVYKPPHVYCWMGFINTLPISLVFEQKRGKSVLSH